MSRFTRIPESTFNELQVNAGVLAKDFDPETGALDEKDIITSTSGGIKVSVKSEYEDYGSDIDNCPKNTKELKRKTSVDVNVTTTALNINKDTLAFGLGASDVRQDGAVVTRKDLSLSDFKTIWWIGDLADGGFLAIKLIDVLSTDGFTLQTTDKNKGKVSLGLTAHMSLNAQTVEPVEFYIGSAEDATPSISLNKSMLNLVEDDTFTLVADTYPADETVTWDTSDDTVASVQDGVVTAEGAGVCVITAVITVSDVPYIASCNISVTAKGEG